MPFLCIPCGSKSAVEKHFDIDVGTSEEPIDEKERIKSPLADDKEFAKPSPDEYAAYTAREFLDVLEAVADSIPAPGLNAAVKLARKLIEACDESHATLERAEELKKRIKTLVTLLVDELKGKKREEIQEKLREDIETLETDLTYVQKKLDEIASQHALLVIFFQSLNQDKVDKCVRRLDIAMERFNLSYGMNQTMLLDGLEKHIMDFYSSQQRTLDILRSDMSKVLAILYERHATDAIPAKAHSRAAVPANSDIFYGRDSLVDELAHILADTCEEGQKHPRVCLLGPGGMGKTSTALAVMAHPEVRKSFPERNQIWVPCVKAKSVSLLLDTLYSSLGTIRNSGDTLKDVISEIKASAEPLILLLDNFETPWNVTESRSEVEEILYELDRIAHISLFITMRSSIPPCEGKNWRSFEIEAVSSEAARQIYLEIYPAGKDDPNLSDLLQALGNMPLAITLMARRGKITGLGARRLKEEYERLGTTMLGQAQSGLDAKHSLDVCISLSVDSQPMKEQPAAYELLASLAMLPIGSDYDALTKTWVPHLPDFIDALQVLLETSLIQRRETQYFVLPVIRSYILAPSRRFPNNVRISMAKSACDFLLQNESSPGDPSFKEHADALSVEEGNLQAILLDINEADPHLMKAYLILAKYQLSRRVRLEVVEHLIKFARQMEGNHALFGDILTCYGRMLFNLDRYDAAAEQFKLAREQYLLVPDERQAALRLLDEVDTYTLSLSIPISERSQLILDAKSVFDRLGDIQGIALCLYYMGFVEAQNGQHEKAVQSIIKAREMFKAIPDVLNQAKSSYSLLVLFHWEKNYDAALRFGKAAVEEYQKLGQYYYIGDSMRLLGKVFFMKDDHIEALDMLLQALETCKAYGSPVSIGQTLEKIGRTWAKMGKNEDAKGAYTEAMLYYNAASPVNEAGLTRCGFLIKQVDDPSLVPTPQEKSMLVGMYKEF